MKNLKTEIVIDAPADKIWTVLMDHEAYPSWNPFIKNISGNTQVGGKLSVKIQSDGSKPMHFTPVVLVNNGNDEFRWVGKLFIKGLFDGEHFFILEPINKNQTRFIHGENFTGLLSGILWKMIGSDTQKGFEAMNVKMKSRVESI